MTKAKQLQRKVKEMNMYAALMKPKWKEKVAEFKCISVKSLYKNDAGIFQGN